MTTKATTPTATTIPIPLEPLESLDAADVDTVYVAAYVYTGVVVELADEADAEEAALDEEAVCAGVTVVDSGVGAAV